MTILVCLVGASFARNAVFLSPLQLWADGVVKSPSKRRPHENYGQALSTEGYYQEALREFSMVLSLKEDDSVPLRDVYREIGVVDYHLGQFDAAINAWQKGLRSAAYDTGLLNNLAAVYYTTQRYEEAEAHAKAVLETDPYMPSALNILGELYLRQSNYAAALASFLRAIEVEPNVASRYWNAALACMRLNRYDEARQYVDRYTSMTNDENSLQEARALIAKLNMLRDGARGMVGQ